MKIDAKLGIDHSEDEKLLLKYIPLSKKSFVFGISFAKFKFFSNAGRPSIKINKTFFFIFFCFEFKIKGFPLINLLFEFIFKFSFDFIFM